VLSDGRWNTSITLSPGTHFFYAEQVPDSDNFGQSNIVTVKQL